MEPKSYSSYVKDFKDKVVWLLKDTKRRQEESARKFNASYDKRGSRAGKAW